MARASSYLQAGPLSPRFCTNCTRSHQHTRKIRTARIMRPPANRLNESPPSSHNGPELDRWGQNHAGIKHHDPARRRHHRV